MALTEIPIELSSTPGIVDNSNATAITIDSSENVGIGTVSPDSILHLSGSSASKIIIEDSANPRGNYIGINSSDNLVIAADEDNLGSSSNIRFRVDATERMRLDDSGNLLVGKTSDAINLAGVVNYSAGIVRASRNGNSGQFGRISTDGDIVTFYKDTVTVGSIASKDGDITIGTGDTGFRFIDGSDAISPHNISTNAGRDAAIDLGTSGGRFKDLYLSGVSYNGDGSASAPSISFGADTNTGFYRVGSDQIGFVTAGAIKAKLDASGNLLVGTTSSSARLTVHRDTHSTTTDLVNISTDQYDAGSVFRTGEFVLFGDWDGTADKMLALKSAGSDVFVVDATGDVGIGTDSPSTPLHVNSGTGNIPATFESTDAGSYINIRDNGSGTFGAMIGAISDDMVFSPNNVERMRLDASGNLLVGTTAAFTSGGTNSGGSGALMIARDNERCLFLKRASSNGAVVEFFRGSITNPVGSISITASATAYNTSSDYRLKENVVAMSGATERLKQLKPSRFNFITDAETTVDGFLAHEVQDIVPEAISGTKDAVDADGNPEYQGIDQSKLVPLLVATIQELEARITQLES